MLIRRLISLSALLLAGCASTPEEAETKFFSSLAASGEVRLTGWAHVKGEFMIFPDRRSMKELFANPPNIQAKADWPQSTRCVSGFFPDWRDSRIYDGQKVVVTGVLKDYESFPRRGGDVFADAKVWRERSIGNWCYGHRILLIRSVRLAG